MSASVSGPCLRCFHGEPSFLCSASMMSTVNMLGLSPGQISDRSASNRIGSRTLESFETLTNSVAAWRAVAGQ